MDNKMVFVLKNGEYGEFQGILQLNKPVQSEQKPMKEDAGRGRSPRPMERSDK